MSEPNPSLAVERLRKLAERARDEAIRNGSELPIRFEAGDAFTDACDPQTILAILSELDQVRGERDDARMAKWPLALTEMMATKDRALAAEAREALLREALESAKAVRVALRVLGDGLPKDAKRLAEGIVADLEPCERALSALSVGSGGEEGEGSSRASRAARIASDHAAGDALRKSEGGAS